MIEGILVKEEVVVGTPPDDLLAVSLEHGDIEGRHLHLLDHLGAGSRRHRTVGRRGPGRGDLAFQPPEGPGTSLLNRCGYGRQGDDEAQAGNVPLVAETGQVVLYPGLPGDEGGRLTEPHRPVGRPQGAAGERPMKRRDGRQQCGTKGDEDPAHVMTPYGGVAPPRQFRRAHPS